MLKFLLRLNTGAAYLASALLWVLVAIICLDVGVRALGGSLLWVSEVSVYLLITIVFLGIGYTLDHDGHFSVTMLTERLPGPQRVALEVVVVALSLVFALLLAWGGVELVRFARSMSLRSPTMLQVPLYLPYCTVVVGAVSLSVSLLKRGLELAAALRGDEPLPVHTEISA